MVQRLSCLLPQMVQLGWDWDFRLLPHVVRILWSRLLRLLRGLLRLLRVSGCLVTSPHAKPVYKLAAVSGPYLDNNLN
jgi:hypothetical protein